MKVDLHPGFILHHRPYRETSLLLDVFSRDHGRTSLVAKGVRQKKNIRSELLQPYQRLQIAWTGKGDLMTLTSVEPDRAAYVLKNKRLLAGFYINELVSRMLHQHEAHQDLFLIYDRTLEALACDRAGEEVTIRIFEKRLLNSVGYGLVLDHDVNTGNPVEPDSIYYYNVHRGPAKTVAVIDDCCMLSGKTLMALDSEQLDSNDVLHEAKQLMRFVLDQHLGSRQLSSRKLYRQYLDHSRNNNLT